MDTSYIRYKETASSPRIPFEIKIDLTYRCNNNCRHCWLKVPLDAEEKNRELSCEEIKHIAAQGRAMGCRQWSISGGEPMVHPDFAQIFDSLTHHCLGYSLNTNGTLITKRIAQFLRRPGFKMVALYGATAQVHDHITRTPGSFRATMQGCAYLREAHADFVTQIVPMRDNYHQFKDMVSLAQSLSKRYRIGSSWFWLSAHGEEKKNREILHQRLAPSLAVQLDKPDSSRDVWEDTALSDNCCHRSKGSHLFSACIARRRALHIDPFGQATFCPFIKDERLRYDLRRGTLKECWEEYLPSLSSAVKANKEYRDACGSCQLRADCRWCPVWGYLEHRNYTAQVKYLCAVAQENKKFKETWEKKHRRYYMIAGITIQVDADLPITNRTFHPKFKAFETVRPGPDVIKIWHHFHLPDLAGKDLGVKVYHKTPWVIYRKGASWIYLGITPHTQHAGPQRVAVFNHDHSRAQIYHNGARYFRKGGLLSLALLPTDQLFIAQILADRNGCYMHSAGINFRGQGFLFVGHSGAGKSTLAAMVQKKAEILCDDRVILRRQHNGFKIFGTWSHGDIQEISPQAVPLRAILFLEKAAQNRLIELHDKKEITKRILACAVRPLTSAAWWEKTLTLVQSVAEEVSCYVLQFDRSGAVATVLERL